MPYLEAIEIAGFGIRQQYQNRRKLTKRHAVNAVMAARTGCEFEVNGFDKGKSSV
jgi:hypothetical protein